MVEKNTSTDTYSNAFRAVGITFTDILTQDSVMKRELEKAKSAAGSDVSVLILGETGTGKNLLAQAIHNGSKRIENSFVSINCSAIPDTLLESELFGHEKGAFTSADRQRRGCFERANLGTIFLDEIGEMTPGAQVKVLHVLEYKEFSKVGGEELLKTDVRVISATNRDLMQEIDRNTFRSDLFYRLNEIIIKLPPLRERLKDIPLYVKYFLEEANEKYSKNVRKLTKSAMRKLDNHKWLGNVRELRSVIRSAVAVTKKDVISDKEIAIMSMPFGSGKQSKKRSTQTFQISREPEENDLDETKLDITEDLSLDKFERNHILKVLQLVRWKKKKASQILNISRPTLDRKIEVYGLHKNMDKD